MVCAEEALKKLIEGNKRFAEDESVHPNRCKETRKGLLASQNPFAVIIACSDSRVPVEIVFDAGIGDLFVVRTAGHVLADASIGSVEYAVEQLGVNLVVVLGHDNCGAIKTALHFEDEDMTHGMSLMIDKIAPAITRAKQENHENEELLIKKAIHYNVINTVKKIRGMKPVLSEAFRSGKIKILGSHYNLETGYVEFIKEEEII